MADSSPKRVRRILLGTAIGIAITTATIVVMEGAASGLLFMQDYRAAAPRSLFRPHMVDDTLLGWSNRPSFTSPDEYGKGILLTTTSEGTRGTGPTDTTGMPGRPGLICSGDSYTMGFGVSDDHAWCALLAKVTGLRTINMGQLDYGLDQSFMLYRRNGTNANYRVHVVGLTNQQLERMTTSNIGGRFKPMLALSGNALVPKDVPVPKQSREAMRRASASHAKDDLRLTQLFRALPGMDSRKHEAICIDEQWTLVDRVIDDLSALDKAHDTRLVLAYLPTKLDLRPGHVDARRKRLADYSREHGITFIDLTSGMRALRPDSLDLAFISRVPRGAAPGVANQYSNLGHAWVAARLSASVLADSR